jgi:3-hydroxyisobutyrate dehydrogenase
MKTGVIGLGAMGAGMADNFHKAGTLAAVWNRTRARADEIAARTGATASDSPAALARECDLIMTCVSRDADVLEVVQAIAEGVARGAVVADTSTVSAGTAQAAARILAERGAHFMDCPVSGGVEGARNGTLAMMAGGEEAVLERCRAALGAIAKTIVYIGPTGSGQACKAVNQLMVAGINQAVTEALAFGRLMGLDMDRVVDVVSSGAAGNWFLTHRGRTMLAGTFAPGFKVNLHHKDLEICRTMAAERRAGPLPLAEMTLKHYEQLMSEGFGDEDISSLFRIKSRNLG